MSNKMKKHGPGAPRKFEEETQRMNLTLPKSTLEELRRRALQHEPRKSVATIIQELVFKFVQKK
jgi:hypothetical protein